MVMEIQKINVATPMMPGSSSTTSSTTATTTAVSTATTSSTTRSSAATATDDHDSILLLEPKDVSALTDCSIDVDVDGDVDDAGEAEADVAITNCDSSHIISDGIPPLQYNPRKPSDMSPFATELSGTPATTISSPSSSCTTMKQRHAHLLSPDHATGTHTTTSTTIQSSPTSAAATSATLKPRPLTAESPAARSIDTATTTTSATSAGGEASLCSTTSDYYVNDDSFMTGVTADYCDADDDDADAGDNSSATLISQHQQQRLTRPSPLDTTTTQGTGVPTLASSVTHEYHHQHQQQQQLPQQHRQPRVWVPIPSPCRPRLDPRYAARMAVVPSAAMGTAASTSSPSVNTGAAVLPRVVPQPARHQSTPPNMTARAPSLPPAPLATTTASVEDHLMLPPGIHRDCDSAALFRPAPIITPITDGNTTLFGDGDADERMMIEDTDDSRVNEGQETSDRHRHFSFQPSHIAQRLLPRRTYTNNSSTSLQQQQHGSPSPRLTSTPQHHGPPSSLRRNSATPTPRSSISSSLSASSVTSTSDVGVSDRFIPSRATSNFHFSTNLWDGMSSGRRRSSRGSSSMGASPHSAAAGGSPAGSGGAAQHDAAAAGAAAAAAAAAADHDDSPDNTNVTSGSTTTSAQSQQHLLNTLLRSELLGENENPLSSSGLAAGGAGAMPYSSTGPHNASSRASPGASGGANGNNSANPTLPLREGGYLNRRFRYQSPRQVYQDSVFDVDAVGPTAIVNSFSLTPIRSAASQRLMAAPTKRKRRISKVPFKVLDAPALQDDFYLNLVDWSSQNVLAVGLGSCVYLWSACTSKVTKLCDLVTTEDVVTAVSWAQRGTHLSVGTNRGEVQLWDTIKCKKVRTMAGHSARVGTLAWTGPIMASGSRDRLIYLRDVRVQAPFTDKLTSHKQEVCGLKWSFDEPAFLASGGNDNHLHVIDSRNPAQPIHRFAEHTAAVKAITWSPHQHGLLASGGGTADRCIRFWNTLSGCALNKIDTGSQVCNLAWSQNCNEIVSTHGYSLNQIVVWRYPSMSKVVTLTGHTYRVLYLAMSPDGSTVVTGAGDETLRFWQVFPGPRSDGKDGSGGLLFPNTLGSVIR